MGMKPIGARVGDRELVALTTSGRDRLLGEPGNTIHVVADRQSMPVHRGGVRKRVGHIDLQPFTAPHSDLRAGKNSSERPRRHIHTTQIDGGRPRGHRDGTDRPGGPKPCLFCGGHHWIAGQHTPPRCRRPTGRTRRDNTGQRQHARRGKHIASRHTTTCAAALTPCTCTHLTSILSS